MSLAQLARAHYNNKIRPKGLKQIILPQADGVTCGGQLVTADAAAVTYGLWADVALKTAVLVDTLVVGILLDTPSATQIYTVDLGSTVVTVNQVTTNYDNAAAVEAVAAAIEPAHRCEIRLEIASNLGAFMPVMLPFPVLYNALTDGILARISTVNATDDTATISVVCIQAFE